MRAALRHRLRRVEAVLLPPAQPPEAEVEFDFSALTLCELSELTQLTQLAPFGADNRLAGDELRRMDELVARVVVRPRRAVPPPAVERDRSPFGPWPEQPPLAPCPGCPRCRTYGRLR